MNVIIFSDLEQAYRHQGAEAFARKLHEVFFPNGSPPNSIPEEKRLFRSLRKVVARICKVHSSMSIDDAVKNVWQVLVGIVWPPPKEKPAATQIVKVNLSVSDVPRPARNISLATTTRQRRSAKAQTPVAQSYKYADAAWWESAWFKYEQNYWKTQENMRERARQEYTEWWLKTLRYVEWWEKILTPQREVRQPAKAFVPVHAVNVCRTSEGALSSAEAKADVGLSKLKKTVQKLSQRPCKPRRKRASPAYIQKVDMPADVAWWKSLLLGNVISDDGEDFTAYLIRHFGAENLIQTMDTIVGPRARNVWLRNELRRKNPRVELSDKLTTKLFLKSYPESPVNMSERGSYGRPKKRTYPGRNINDPKMPPSTTPTAESVLADIRG